MPKEPPMLPHAMATIQNTLASSQRVLHVQATLVFSCKKKRVIYFRSSYSTLRKQNYLSRCLSLLNASVVKVWSHAAVKAGCFYHNGCKMCLFCPVCSVSLVLYVAEVQSMNCELCFLHIL